MKPSTFVLITALTTSGALSAAAQTLPGAPEDNGLTPTTATAYVNGTNLYAINNFGVESLSLDMARNGNVIIGWEDDGDGLNDIEAGSAQRLDVRTHEGAAATLPRSTVAALTAELYSVPTDVTTLRVGGSWQLRAVP